MPNWCEGTLKIRGEAKDIERFMYEGLEINHYESFEDGGIKIVSEKPEYKNGNFSNNTPGYFIHIKGTRRGFVTDILNYFEPEWGPVTEVAFSYRQAWDIIADNLKDIAKEYHLDMKIQGFELGMEFSHIVEVNREGEILQDETIHYNDYFWDCPCPELGG